MASIFPGMDPYLEDPAYWEDFHRRFITALADDLLQLLPDSYDARIDERVRLVEADSEQVSRRLPDISIHRPTDSLASIAPHPTAQGNVAVLEPVALPLMEMEERRDVWVEIIHLPEQKLVTAIEVFSPTNKQGGDAADYHSKRLALYTRHVNLVEIDLLRGGRRLEFAAPLPAGDYYAFITRGRSKSASVYSWHLRDKLPTIAIPLQAPDADVQLDLATIFSDAFERGRYARRLRYDKPLDPPIRNEDREWVGSILGARH